jgi:hypothetical protein
MNPRGLRDGHGTGEEGAFAVTFVDSAPARIARQI